MKKATLITLLGMPFALAGLMTWVALVENPQQEFLRDDGSWVLESVFGVFGSWLVAALLVVAAIWSLWKICVKRFR
jgi:hypothetical protein